MIKLFKKLNLPVSPEYEEKKAFVTGRTLIGDHYYVMYYYEDQFKIAEKYF